MDGFIYVVSVNGSPMTACINKDTAETLKSHLEKESIKLKQTDTITIDMCLFIPDK
jgi:hypothetical protein